MKFLNDTNMENELVFLAENGCPVTNSMKVAEVFGKRNSNVLRDIRELDCSKEFRELNFELCHEIKQLEVGSTKMDYYQMTKDGFTFLVMGYTGAKAAQFKEAYIKAFNDMDRRLKSAFPDISQISKKDLARMLLESETQLEKVSEELALMKRGYVIPVMDDSLIQKRMDKLEKKMSRYFEPLYKSKAERERLKLRQEVISYKSQSARARINRISPGAMLIRDMCRELGRNYSFMISSKKVFEWFRQEGWLLSSGERFNLPSEEMIKNKLMVSLNAGTADNGAAYATPYITKKGVEYFGKLLEEKGGIL